MRSPEEQTGLDRVESGEETPSPSAQPRRLVLLTGDPVVQRGRLCEALAGLEPSDLLWVGREAPAPQSAVAASEVQRYLGSESRLLVFDAYSGFDPDAFAAAVGTLRGGGDCVVIAPSLEVWPTRADPYLARITPYPLSSSEMGHGFLRRLSAIWSKVPGLIQDPEASGWHPRRAPVAAGPPILSQGQTGVIEQIVRVARGHARRPLLLSADRGRGKSTALGRAAARLLLDGFARITVVAPHRRAVETLFRQACAAAGIGFAGVDDIAIGRGELRFRTAQDCLAPDAETPGLLMVDEAAGFPVAVLQALLGRSNRLVFATTEHGYEGSGRGFGLRFAAIVGSLMPQYRQARLEDPVRWPSDDPLEAIVNRSLLLDVEATPPPALGETLVERVDPRTWAGNEDLLTAVFGLLVAAHYQTRPCDLRQLLDNPQLAVWIARRGGSIAGVLLGVIEGGFDPEIAAEVLSGRRRPRGHLLPQSLAVHAGLDEVLGLRTLRVQRIAVHPSVHRQGIGRRLCDAAAGWAADRHLDLLGCAFGVDAGRLAFWRRLGFEPARVGVRVDPASAAHTLFMLRGVSESGQRLATVALRQLCEELPWALGGPLKDLPQDVAIALLRGGRHERYVLGDRDRVALERISTGARDPATATGVVWRWLLDAASQGDGIAGLSPLLAWRLQHWPAERVCRIFDLAGANALKRLLRERLTEWLKASARAG